MKKSIFKIKEMLELEKIPFDFNIQHYEGHEYYFLKVLPKKKDGLFTEYFITFIGTDKNDYLCDDYTYCEIEIFDHSKLFEFEKDDVKLVFNTDGMFKYEHFYILPDTAFKIIKKQYLKELES